jgi:hypothetical protein
MPGFCSNCGSPLRDDAAFCQGCGARTPAQPAAQAPQQPPQYQAPAPPQPPPQYQAPAPPQPYAYAPPPAAAAPPAKSGGALKVVLIVLGVLFLVGLLAVAGIVYAGYRIKNRVEQAARSRGVDLSELTDTSRGAARNVDPCSLLSASEASRILEVSIDRTERSGTSCQYFSAAAAEKAKETFQTSMNQLESRSNAAEQGAAASSSPSEMMRQSGMEELAKSATGMAGAGAPYLTLTVDERGKAAIAAMRLAVGLVSPVKVTEDLKGVADDAVLGPMDSLLMFVKNGTAVQLDLRLVPQGKARGIALAKEIAPRL